MAEEQKKYYLLYNNKAQEKLLSSATSSEEILEESQYYSSGSWFEYDDKNNRLANEKYVPSIKFPKEPKIREPYLSAKSIALKNVKIKWVN